MGALLLDSVTVVPRNGYANRLQAWASAAILAAHFDAPLKVLWEKQPVAQASAEDLFDAGLIARTFITGDSVSTRFGAEHFTLPRGLTFDPSLRTVVLAGHELGEQAFMPELVRIIDHLDQPVSLLIIAGGKFHLPDGTNFDRQRQIFYQGLRWADAINNRFNSLHLTHQPYLGLHIRETDRSVEAPSNRTISSALQSHVSADASRSLFIAADSPHARDVWARRAAHMGFQPWWAESTQFDRSTSQGGVDALIDWRLLAGSSGIIYPAASTFSAEAAVAGGVVDVSDPLTSSPSLQRWRRGRETFAQAATYPVRRWKRP